jgi:hypothetical protein
MVVLDTFENTVPMPHVGRIAAIRNRLHNEYHGDRTGFFGFFDFADDDTAAALLETAGGRLRELGLTSLRGPYSPSINDRCGLLSAGFDDPPSVFMPWNPSRYVETYQKLGLSEVRRLSAFSMDMTAPADPLMVRLSERARAKAAELATGREVRVRPPQGVHVAASAVAQEPIADELVPGTTLTRDWRGQRLVVRVTERGFEWNGRGFSSLTAVAKAITGASWNGRLFFGLGPRRAS